VETSAMHLHFRGPQSIMACAFSIFAYTTRSRYTGLLESHHMSKKVVEHAYTFSTDIKDNAQMNNVEKEIGNDPRDAVKKYTYVQV